MTKYFLMGVVAGLMLACGVAQAQDAAATKPELNRVDDWLVRCFPVASPSPCDMLQELDDQRTRQRVVALSIAFYPSLNRHALQVTVPLEISIP